MSRTSQRQSVVPKLTGDVFVPSAERNQVDEDVRKKLTAARAGSEVAVAVDTKEQQGDVKSAAKDQATTSQTTMRCLVCHKDTGDVIRPCACSSRFMHDACMLGHLLQSLDKPCQMCGHFYRSSFILSRTETDSSRKRIFCRNKMIVQALFTSLVGAYYSLLAGNPGQETADFFSFVFQQIDRLCRMPFIFLLATILLHHVFQLYLHRPISPFYFADHSRKLDLVDPTTNQRMNLYVRSSYGLLVDTATGTSRLINKHLLDTKRKWRLHRLMEP